MGKDADGWRNNGGEVTLRITEERQAETGRGRLQKKQQGERGSERESKSGKERQSWRKRAEAVKLVFALESVTAVQCPSLV